MIELIYIRDDIKEHKSPSPTDGWSVGLLVGMQLAYLSILGILFMKVGGYTLEMM